MNMQSDPVKFCGIRRGLCAAVALTALAGAHAESLDFTRQARNLSPVAGLFLLAPPVPADTPGLSATWATASHALGESEGNQVVLFDGETSVFSATLTHRLNERWRVAATLPYVWHSAGALDPFIDDWHSLFGFPDGIRDDVPRDQIVFDYTRGGDPVIAITRNQHGIGDLRLAAHWAPAALDARDLGLAFGIKLPTGDADKLTGSGSADVSVALHWQRADRTSRWSSDASAGLAWLGDSDIDLGDQATLAWLGHLALAYRVSDRLQLGGRLQFHQGPVRDAPDPLSDPSIQIVIGGALAIGQRWRLDITVDEDLNVETAPDVIFRVGLTRRFD